MSAVRETIHFTGTHAADCNDCDWVAVRAEGQVKEQAKRHSLDSGHVVTYTEQRHYRTPMPNDYRPDKGPTE